MMDRGGGGDIMGVIAQLLGGGGGAPAAAPMGPQAQPVAGAQQTDQVGAFLQALTGGGAPMQKNRWGEDVPGDTMFQHVGGPPAQQAQGDNPMAGIEKLIQMIQGGQKGPAPLPETPNMVGEGLPVISNRDSFTEALSARQPSGADQIMGMIAKVLAGGAR
jgi:hypothetical protein